MRISVVSDGRADRPEPRRRAQAGGRRLYRLFGLTVTSGFKLPGLTPVAIGHGGPRVTLDLADRARVVAAFSGPPVRRTQLVLGGGRTVDVVLGTRSDRLLSYGREALFYVGPGGDQVLCAPVDRKATGWQRVLLDTVLGAAALAQGYEALHAGAVELAEGVVAVAAPSGGGKSTLCAELVVRGARFFSDDLVFLERRHGGVLAHPGPPMLTVPAGWSAEGRPAGEVLSADAEEVWISVAGGCQEPAPLLAVLILDRVGGAGPARTEPPRTPMELLTAALHSVLEPDRQGPRLELLAELARSTAVRRLVADPAASPAAVAAVVESTARDLARA